MIFLLATLAGSVGGLARYWLAGVVQEGTRSGFPVGTLSVNLVGAFLLGVIAGIDSLESPLTLVAAGLLGGFTTFSTWIVETIRLGIWPVGTRAGLNLTIALLAGGALAGIGYTLTS